MTIATTIITSGFIIPSTIIIVMGATQQTQHAVPCLHPSRKLVSCWGHEMAHPDGERQRNRCVIFQRAPTVINDAPESKGTARPNNSDRIAAAANATPNA